MDDFLNDMTFGCFDFDRDGHLDNFERRNALYCVMESMHERPLDSMSEEERYDAMADSGFDTDDFGF